jgi:hypothetical protein
MYVIGTSTAGSLILVGPATPGSTCLRLLQEAWRFGEGGESVRISGFQDLPPGGFKLIPADLYFSGWDHKSASDGNQLLPRFAPHGWIIATLQKTDEKVKPYLNG